MKKRLILVSLDALSTTDFSLVKNLPHFKTMIENGAYCPKEYSVYPSLTFPCHATISTGCRPGTHGIVSNYLFDPYRKIPHWNFYAANLKKKGLWDYANQNGKTVLNMSWPVTSGAKIRWSMPEMTPVKPKVWTTANFFRQLEVFRRYGTPLFAVQSFLAERGLMKNWLTGKQPDLDRHITTQFQRAVRQYPYDIAMLHVYGMDNAKHTYGIDSPEAHSFLKFYDDFLGNLIAYVDERKQAGESICLMVTGDHSQLPVNKAIYLNMLLNHIGLCRYKGGKLADWDAIFAPCDGSAYLYVKHPEQTAAVVQRVRKALADNPAVQAIFTPEEAAALGADPQCALMVEAASGYGTEVAWHDPQKLDSNFTGPFHCKGLHGFLPDRPDYQTMFFCYGADVRPGFEIQDMCITDIMPTICHWMNMPIEPVDGKAIPDIFRT